MDADAVNAKLQNCTGGVTIITTDDWHYCADEPITVGSDFIEFAMGIGDEPPRIRLPLDRVADIIC